MLQAYFFPGKEQKKALVVIPGQAVPFQHRKTVFASAEASFSIEHHVVVTAFRQTLALKRNNR